MRIENIRSFGDTGDWMQSTIVKKKTRPTESEESDWSGDNVYIVDPLSFRTPQWIVFLSSSGHLFPQLKKYPKWSHNISRNHRSASNDLRNELADRWFSVLKYFPRDQQTDFIPIDHLTWQRCVDFACCKTLESPSNAPFEHYLTPTHQQRTHLFGAKCLFYVYIDFSSIM